MYKNNPSYLMQKRDYEICFKVLIPAWENAFNTKNKLNTQVG